jgi:hypothetical protein
MNEYIYIYIYVYKYIRKFSSKRWFQYKISFIRNLYSVSYIFTEAPNIRKQFSRQVQKCKDKSKDVQDGKSSVFLKTISKKE